MADLFTFPDIEAAIVTYLGDVLTVPVSTRVPSERPASFVRVVRTGGGRRNLVTDSPFLTAEAWAPTDPEAYSLAARVRAYLHATPGTFVSGVWVTRAVDVGGPASSPDPLSGASRYVLTVQLDVRGGSS